MQTTAGQELAKGLHCVRGKTESLYILIQNNIFDSYMKEYKKDHQHNDLLIPKFCLLRTTSLEFLSPEKHTVIH